MKANDTIIIERRAIYASSTSSERQYERTVVEIETIKGQSARLVTLADKNGRFKRFRQVGNYLIASYPRAAKYEIVSYGEAS